MCLQTFLVSLRLTSLLSARRSASFLAETEEHADIEKTFFGSIQKLRLPGMTDYHKYYGGLEDKGCNWPSRIFLCSSSCAEGLWLNLLWEHTKHKIHTASVWKGQKPHKTPLNTQADLVRVVLILLRTASHCSLLFQAMFSWSSDCSFSCWRSSFSARVSFRFTRLARPPDKMHP